MPSISKYRSFVREPLGMKNIDTISGVGKVTSNRLKNKGFKRASHLVGLFMILSNSRVLFQSYLHWQLKRGIS